MDEHRENEESYECFVFCNRHLEQGKKDLKQGGKERIRQQTEKDLIAQKLKKVGKKAFSGRINKSSGKTNQNVVRRDDNFEMEDGTIDEENDDEEVDETEVADDDE